jgi:hypothetical protein
MLLACLFSRLFDLLLGEDARLRNPHTPFLDNDDMSLDLEENPASQQSPIN